MTESSPTGGLLLDRYPTNSRLAESYRTLRTNVDFSFIERRLSTLLVTSAGQAEGKTTTVANLAYTMADAGRRVLMIDADLRKPVLSRIRTGKESIGLSGLLSEKLATDVHEGTLETFSVSDLYRLLSFRKATGRLLLQSGTEQILLSFVNGTLSDVNWLTRPDNRKLATILVKNGLLTEAQANRAIARKKSSGQKLGFILINMGLVKEEDLSGFIVLHMLEGLRTALQMDTGTFAFKKLSDRLLEKPSFSPADLNTLYKKAIIGEENFIYLEKVIDEALVPTEKGGMYLLPSGPRPPKPSELMGSDRMAFLVSYLERRFDVLVIDTPPVLPASDAVLLSPLVDGVLMVVKAGSMNREMIAKAVGQLRVAKANIIGVNLNQVDLRREAYYKYYNYYSRYYGSSGGRKGKAKT